MWHLTACKVSVSLLFLNWIKNEMIFLSYLWTNVVNFYLTFCDCINQYINLLNLSWIIKCLFLRHMEPLTLQSSRKRRIRRIFTPIFAFVRVKCPSGDSYLRSIATGRPNWTSKTYRGLPKFLLSVEIDTRDVQKLSKSPPTFNELYDVYPAYLLEIRYLCWLSFKDVPLSACGSLLTSVSGVAAPF